MFIVAGLHEGFPYVEVLLLDHTISLGVIWGDLDMMDPIFFRGTLLLLQMQDHCQ